MVNLEKFPVSVPYIIEPFIPQNESTPPPGCGFVYVARARVDIKEFRRRIWAARCVAQESSESGYMEG